MKTPSFVLALSFLASVCRAALPCHCTTNVIAIQTYIGTAATGPWCAADQPPPGYSPVIYILVTNCMCANAVNYPNPPLPPGPSPVQILTNYPTGPFAYTTTTNVWSILTSQIPDPLAPSGYPPYYTWIILLVVQHAPTLAGPWTDSDMCVTNWISQYSRLSVFYSNSIPLLTNTVMIGTNGLSLGAVGFKPVPEPGVPQQFYKFR